MEISILPTFLDKRKVELFLFSSNNSGSTVSGVHALITSGSKLKLSDLRALNSEEFLGIPSTAITTAEVRNVDP